MRNGEPAISLSIGQTATLGDSLQERRASNERTHLSRIDLAELCGLYRWSASALVGGRGRILALLQGNRERILEAYYHALLNR